MRRVTFVLCPKICPMSKNPLLESYRAAKFGILLQTFESGATGPFEFLKCTYCPFLATKFYFSHAFKAFSTKGYTVGQ